MFFSGNVTLSFYAVDIFRMATNGVDMVNFIFGVEVRVPKRERRFFAMGIRLRNNPGMQMVKSSL